MIRRNGDRLDLDGVVEAMAVDGFEAEDLPWSAERIVSKDLEGEAMPLPIDLLREGYLSEEEVAETLRRFPGARFYGAHVGPADAWVGTLVLDGYVDTPVIAHEIRGQGWPDDPVPFWRIEDPNKAYGDLSPESDVIFTVVREVPAGMVRQAKEYTREEVCEAIEEEEGRRRAYGIGGCDELDEDSGDLDFNPKALRRNVDERLRRLERDAARGDPDAEARLAVERLRAGVVTPPSRRLTVSPERSPEWTAAMLEGMEVAAWLRIENWVEDRVPMDALGDARTQLAFAVHILQSDWRFMTEPWIYDDLDQAELEIDMPSKGEAVELWEKIVPCHERRVLLAGAWRRLAHDQRAMFVDHFGRRAERILSAIQCVNMDA